MAGAGLRVGEAVALDWADVDLAIGTLTVRESKTAAGEWRQVDLPVGLREELTEWKARSPMSGRSDPVFISSAREGSHARQTVRNVQARMKTAIKAANATGAAEPISERVSPHALRRLYASLRAALRDDPVYIAEQLGHRDPGFTFRVYQRAAKRRERLSGPRLAAFDHAMEWAQLAVNGGKLAQESYPAQPASAQQTPETQVRSDNLAHHGG